MTGFQQPPSPPGSNPFLYQPPQGQPYGYAAPRTSGMAIGSLVCGICSLVLCGLIGIPGLILGIAALSGINKSQGMITGKGLAITGIVTSVLSLLLTFALIALLVPALGKARDMAREAATTARLRLNGQQLVWIAWDYEYDNGTLPAADNWVAEFRSFMEDPAGVDELVHLPGFEADGRAMAMNIALDGKALGELDDTTNLVLFFECDRNSPLAGGAELLPAEPRHERGFLIVFADGMVSQIPPEGLYALRWSP